MANYNINSGNLTSLGTADADNFYFRSGGGPNVVINAQAGNDSTYIQQSQSAIESGLDKLFLSLQGGADYLLASAGWNGEASATTIKGGAGGDSFTMQLAGVAINNFAIDGGDGSDSAAYFFSSVVDSTINAGSGADTTTLSAVSINSSSFGMGSGNDSLTVSASTASSSSFVLGGGNDTGNFDIANASSVTFNGGAGNDAITYSGLTIGSAKFLGEDGNDSITFSAGTASNVSFQGAEGNDTLAFVTQDVQLFTSVSIIGGAGTDSIYFSGAEAGTGVAVVGGGGHDTINIANMGPGTPGAASNANQLYITYNTTTESNYSTFDRIIGSANQTAVVKLENLSLNSVSNGTYSWGYVADGVAFFTGGSPTLEQAIDYLDDVLNVGQAVGFSAQGTDPYTGNLNNNSYLFVQAGGQNGDANADYLIQASNTPANGEGAGQVRATRVDATTNTLNVRFS